MLRMTIRAATLGAVLIVLPCVVRADQNVACWSSGPNQDTCRIDEPTVSQRVSEYRQIRLHYGDHVRVKAGGCVQTGGHGRTWKRYVNPSGPNSDHLYFGLMRLPHFNVDFESNDALNGFERISDRLHQNMEVHSPPCDPRADCVQRFPGDDVGWLRLGYADDDYSDNGYWGHDDGTEDQCRGSENAWVEVTIDRYQAETGLEENIDRPGLDYKRIVLPQARADLCREACRTEGGCVAFTYVKPGVQEPSSVCYLKDGVPERKKDECCVSGVK
jgi:hypothetical protein